MNHETTIRRLYQSLNSLDGDAMAECYTPDATFEDPVFGRLHGKEVGAMWRMLTDQSTGVHATVFDVEVDGDRVTARWEARYAFGARRRPVVNRATAEYRFEDGLIAEHRDRFSFHRWARQALGVPGWVLGWAPTFRAGVRARARSGLGRHVR